MRTRAKKGEWKAQCSKCNEEKYKSEFYTGRGSTCKVCSNRINKKWRTENKKHLQEYYIERKDHVLAYGKVYVSVHREQTNAAAKRRRDLNPLPSREGCKNWRKNNLVYDAYRTRLYNANKAQAVPLWANRAYMKLWYKLAKIEQERTGKEVQVDHIIPLNSNTVCGLHCEDNMQLLFKEDNCSKGNRYANTG